MVPGSELGGTKGLILGGKVMVSFLIIRHKSGAWYWSIFGLGEEKGKSNNHTARCNA